MSSTSRTFPPDHASVPAARRFAHQVFTGWDSPGGPDVLDVVEVLVSEVATNSVIHARSAFTVEVLRGDFGAGDALRVRIADESPALPRRRTYGTDATTGRGVRLVDTLSNSWTAERLPDGGKVVTFDVLLESGRAAAFTDWEASVDVDAEALLAQFSEFDGSTRARAHARSTCVRRESLAA